MSFSEKLQKLLEPVVENAGFDLVDVEYRNEGYGMVLRAFIDKIDAPENTRVTLDDCSAVSRKISEFLDKENVIDNSYALEVSSPGLYRRIKKEKDFIKYTGSKVTIKLYQTKDGQKNFIGRIQKYENNRLFLEIAENKVIEVGLCEITTVNLDPDLKI
ncbi:MAG: hypothetical protein A2252_05350 [Elusimicrobia bacterium RIFOXYA2_FULL_39_19]|nr:MAG: hypothetical protein A2252_05350 [Elusimicrobia bacterium RIFOXYA2_FULL_39_19]